MSKSFPDHFWNGHDCDCLQCLSEPLVKPWRDRATLAEQKAERMNAAESKLAIAEARVAELEHCLRAFLDAYDRADTVTSIANSIAKCRRVLDVPSAKAERDGRGG